MSIYNKMDSQVNLLRYSDECCRVCNTQCNTITTSKKTCKLCKAEVCAECIYQAPFYDYFSSASKDHGMCYKCLGWRVNENRCSLCLSPFSYLLFRHHCRKCGANICDYCSAYDSSGKRVCHHH